MRTFTKTFLPAVVLTITQSSVAAGDAVFIDFERLPNGDPTTSGELIGDAYAAWGVHFGSIGVSDMPEFFEGYNSDGMFARTSHAAYPPGFNIVVELNLPVFTVSADVMTAAGHTITMVAKDVRGDVIDSVESDPAPSTFWAGNLLLTTGTPIASVEWWPSSQAASVGIDNLGLLNPGCSGDLDADGDVDLADLAALLAEYPCV